MTHDSSSQGIDLDPDAVYALDPRIVRATFDDQVVLYHLGKRRALTLNQSAGIILELIDSRCRAAEIRELLERAYPESAADVGRDVDRTLRYLLRHGAIEPAEDQQRKIAAGEPVALEDGETFGLAVGR